MENFNQQGRKQKQYEDSAKIASIAGLGLVLTIVILVIDNLING